MSYHYFALAGLASIKFMFAPLYGLGVGLNFYETYFSLLAGGVLTSFLFYKLTFTLLERSKVKRQLRRKQALDMGFEYFEPKKFTRTNKFVVRMRRRFGFVICAFFFPFFLSVPVGTIIATKFFGDKKLFFPLVALGLAVNGFIATSILYLI